MTTKIKAGVIGDGVVGTTQIADDAVTLAKMAGLARGKLIVGDASGNPSALALGSANYVLTSDGTDVSWAASQVEESPTFTGNVAVGGTLGVTGTATFTGLVDAATIDGVNFKVNGGQGSDGQVLTSTGSGVAWEDASGGATDINGLSDAKTFGTGSIMLGDTTTGTLSNANYNVGVGVDMLHSLTSGYANIAIGFESCKDLTTGHNNVAVGHATLYENIDGQQNVAVGSNALQNNTSGSSSVAIGKSALVSNTTASNNTAVGYEALRLNTTGTYNVAVGKSALAANTTASNNTALGYQALDANTTGAFNVAVGTSTMGANTTGNKNVAMGVDALLANTTGERNVGVGYIALNDNTTGGGNVAVGNNALGATTTANGTTGLGDSAGYGNTTGYSNTFVGNSAGAYAVLNTTGFDNTMVGALSHGTSATAVNINVFGRNVAGEQGYTTIGIDGSDIRAAHGNVTWATVSDRRVKKDIEDSTTGLSFINALKPRTFKYKNLGELPETFRAYEAGSTEAYKNSKTQHGFIAQEVKTAIDADNSIKDGFTFWDDRDDGSQEVAESALISVLVKALQEADDKIEALTTRITALES